MTLPGTTTSAIPSISSARDRILDAAADLFYSRGINATGIDAIVRQSGVAKMTLYKHFSSKDLLIAAWLERASGVWRANLIANLDRIGSDPKTKLEGLFDCLAEWFADPGFRGCAFINCLAEIPDVAHPARIVCAIHRRHVREYLAALCRQAGLADPTSLGESLAMMVDGATVAALAEGSPDAARRAGKLVKELVASSRVPG